MDSALKKLKKQATYLLKRFYWYKDNLSGNFLCAKNFFFQAPPPPPPHNVFVGGRGLVFGFWLVTVPFSLLRANKHPLSMRGTKSKQYNVVIFRTLFSYVQFAELISRLNILFSIILNSLKQMLTDIFYELYSSRSACFAGLCSLL